MYILSVNTCFIRKQSEDREAKISVTKLSLKQFSKKEWKLKQDQLIEKVPNVIIFMVSDLLCAVFFSYINGIGCR